MTAPRSLSIGRDDERGRLAALAESARRGHSAALVLRGEAGIGKTDLLDHLAGAAGSMRIIRVTGVESEMELAYAALHQFCTPLIPLRERLPSPQRNALGVVVGLDAGPAPDRFLVGLAVLNLLAEAARDRPLLCLVDDAHWLDRASAQVLAFVARRLRVESVLLVFATRLEQDELAGVPDLQVHGLSEAEARSLLAAELHGPVDERVRDVIVAEAGGNPLALLELVRGVTPVQLAGGYGIAELASAPERIERRLRRRVAALPADARLLLLVAAADSAGDPAVLWRAADGLGIGAPAALAVHDSGLLDIGARATFRHPLVRSAIYRAASPADRRAVHAALADATDPEHDADRRAWHRAQAAVAPDDDVADGLEQAAGRARARGGAAAAAAFLQRAAVLTVDAPRRIERQLAAAEATLDAGGLDAAESLVAAVQAGPSDKTQLARAQLLRGHLAFARDFGHDAPPLLLDAARQFEPLDDRRARDTYLEALSAALLAGRLATGVDLTEVARAVHAARPAAGFPRPSDALLDGVAAFVTDGPERAAPALSGALAAFCAGEVPAEQAIRWLWLAGHAAGLLWDYDRWAVASRWLLLSARESGAVSMMPVALSTSAGAALLAGQLADAAALAAEEAMVAEVTGGRIAPYGSLGFAAFAGREADAARLIVSGGNDVRRRGEGVGVSFIGWAAAVLYNGLGRYADAFEAAQDAAYDVPAQRFRNWALSELVEAAVRTGRLAEAADASRRLRRSPRSATGPGRAASRHGRERCWTRVPTPRISTGRPSGTSRRPG